MDRIKYLLGWVLAKLFPKKVDKVYNNFTIPENGNIAERLIRFYLAYKMKKQERNSQNGFEEVHKNFWSKSDTYFYDTKNRTEEIHIPSYKDIVQEVIPLLVDKNIQTVFEFGSGDGAWLNYLSQQWEVVKEFIGIDIANSSLVRYIIEATARKFFSHSTE